MAEISIYKTTLFRKILMSLTGLFIAFFLIIHLFGNLFIIYFQNRETAKLEYNWWAETLSHNLFIEVIAFMLYATILIHIFDALYITFQNFKAGGQKLNKDKRGKVSGWYKRNMGVLGMIILIFLVIHLKDYWYVYKFDEGFNLLDANGRKDVYTIVEASFKNLWYVILYVVAFVGLGYHLAHGISSGFRTLGIYNRSYIKIIKYLGIAFAIIIPLGYAIIPIIVYLKNMS